MRRWVCRFGSIAAANCCTPAGMLLEALEPLVPLPALVPLAPAEDAPPALSVADRVDEPDVPVALRVSPAPD